MVMMGRIFSVFLALILIFNVAMWCVLAVATPPHPSGIELEALTHVFVFVIVAVHIWRGREK